MPLKKYMTFKNFLFVVFIIGTGVGLAVGSVSVLRSPSSVPSTSSQYTHSNKVFHTTKGIYNQIFDAQISVVSFAATNFQDSQLPAYQLRIKGRIFPLKENIKNSVMLAWDLPADSIIIDGPHNQEISADEFNYQVQNNNGYYETTLEVLVPSESTLSFSASTTEGQYKLGNTATLKATLESLQSTD